MKLAGYHDTETFFNYGSIQVLDGGVLHNLAEMDIISDEDNGGGAPSLQVLQGGLLETDAGTKMNFDTLALFSVSGTVNNRGSISSDQSTNFFQDSTFTNSGTFQIKNSGIFRGSIHNSGLFANVAQGLNGGAGYVQQISQDFQNLLGATLDNQGEFRNFTTIDNYGLITNDSAAASGNGLGTFTNLSGARLNNYSTGVITNRERFFNNGRIDNAGTFNSHSTSLGISNAGGAQFNNLVGGVLNVDIVINSAGAITNAGIVYINGGQTTAFGIRGTGTYAQTAGETQVNSTLQADDISFTGGILSGNGIVVGPTSIDELAVLSPGLSVGALEFHDDLTLNGMLAVELESVSSYDAVRVGGVLWLGESSVLDLSFLQGFTPNQSQSFDLITAENIAGEFGALQMPDDLPPQFHLVYLQDHFGTTDVVRLTAVPEPASTFLMVFASVGILFMSHQRCRV